jgi:MFS family permease
VRRGRRKRKEREKKKRVKILTISSPTDLVFIIFLVDRVGRKRPLLFGSLGISIALICEAVVNSQNTDGSNRGLSIAGVFFLFSVTVIFSLSFGPVSWVYMSEVMPFQ